jgi:hypothetical protein
VVPSARERRRADSALAGDVIADRPPCSLGSATKALGLSVLRTAGLLRQRSITQPTHHLGRSLAFADGTHGRVYRETVVRCAEADRPALLVVSFRLRGVRGRGHDAFRAESLLNTPLFAGFPGFVSKLWLAHDENGVYRGVYQWSEPDRADAYVRALWWVLALVSERASIRYVVVPGLRVDDVLADPRLLDVVADDRTGWWRPTAVDDQ